MAWGRFGFGPLDDDQPIELWMNDQNDQVAQRDALGAAGRQRWDTSTRSGENLDASRPTDVVALGSGTVAGDAGRSPSAGSSAGVGGDRDMGDATTPAPSRPGIRYVKARPGDNITRLVASGEPGAVGADPAARGFRLPADLNGGKGWRPKELGLTKYKWPERVWRGTPVPLRDALAAISIADAPAFYDSLGQRQ